jgi:hypothetical protein
MSSAKTCRLHKHKARRPARYAREGVTMSILLATALLLAIITGCVGLLVGTNMLTEIVQRRMTAAELVRTAEALVKAEAAHQAR